MTQPTRETALDMKGAVMEQTIKEIKALLLRWCPIIESLPATEIVTPKWGKAKEDFMVLLERLWATAYEEGVEWAKENYQPAMGTRE